LYNKLNKVMNRDCFVKTFVHISHTNQYMCAKDNIVYGNEHFQEGVVMSRKISIKKNNYVRNVQIDKKKLHFFIQNNCSFDFKMA